MIWDKYSLFTDGRYAAAAAIVPPNHRNRMTPCTPWRCSASVARGAQTLQSAKDVGYADRRAGSGRVGFYRVGADSFSLCR